MRKKKRKENINKASTTTSLAVIGQLLNISPSDTIALNRRRRMLVLIGIILILIGIIAGCISEPPGVHYMGIGTLDFNWITRLLR
jgi:hypothetical protein